MTDKVPYEPAAEMRMAARQIRDMYKALTLEGFTEQQTIAILGQVLAAGQSKGNGA